MQNDEEYEEDLTFPQEEIEGFCSGTCDQILKDKSWDEKILPNLQNEICEMLMAKLVAMNKPYKYVISCVLQQRGGTTFMSTSCHWENTTDGQWTCVYPPISRAAKEVRAI